MSGDFNADAWGVIPFAGGSAQVVAFVYLPQPRGSVVDARPGEVDPGMTVVELIAGEVDPDMTVLELSLDFSGDDMPGADPGQSIVEGW